MKKQVSSLDIHRLVAEMQCLVGGFLQKAYLPSRAMLVLTFSTKQGKRALVTLVGRCAYLTGGWNARDEKRTGGPPRFVATIRKALPNAFVTAVFQLGMDRIIRLDLQKDESHSIIIELFGRGNVMLLREGEIVLPLVTKAWKAREIRHGQQYMRPPGGHDLSRMEVETLKGVLNASKSDLARTLATEVNLGGTYAEEACLRADVDGSSPSSGLDEGQVKAIHSAIRGLFKDLTLSSGGVLVYDTEGKAVEDVVPFPLRLYSDRRTEEVSSLSKALETYFAPIAAMLEKGIEPDAVLDGVEAGGDHTTDDIIAKLERKVAMQGEAIARFEAEAEATKLDGDTIYLHFKECNDVLEAVKDSKEEVEEWDKVMTRFPGLSIVNGIPTLTMDLAGPSGEQRAVRLDPRKNVDGNARALYEASKKAREKADGARKALDGTRVEIGTAKAEAERAIKERTRSTTGTNGYGNGGLRHSRKEFWFERFRWFVSSGGNIVVAGRDARTNEQVVKRYLDDGDRYSHAEVSGAPSVVIKAKDPFGGDLPVDEATLGEACHFALCMSRAWGSRAGEGNAYWVLPEQVSKTPSSGEFVPRGGFIIRGKRNYVRGMGLGLAIGIIDLGKGRAAGQPEERLMCGPIPAVERHCSRYAVIGPAKGKKSDIAKDLSKSLGTSMEECERALPPGGSEVRRWSPAEGPKAS